MECLQQVFRDSCSRMLLRFFAIPSLGGQRQRLSCVKNGFVKCGILHLNIMPISRMEIGRLRHFKPGWQSLCIAATGKCSKRLFGMLLLGQAMEVFRTWLYFPVASVRRQPVHNTMPNLGWACWVVSPKWRGIRVWTCMGGRKIGYSRGLSTPLNMVLGRMCPFSTISTGQVNMEREGAITIMIRSHR